MAISKAWVKEEGDANDLCYRRNFV